MEVVASLSQGRTAAAQCGLFTYISVPVIFEPPGMMTTGTLVLMRSYLSKVKITSLVTDISGINPQFHPEVLTHYLQL